MKNKLKKKRNTACIANARQVSVLILSDLGKGGQVGQGHIPVFLYEAILTLSIAFKNEWKTSSYSMTYGQPLRKVVHGAKTMPTVTATVVTPNAS